MLLRAGIEDVPPKDFTSCPEEGGGQHQEDVQQVTSSDGTLAMQVTVEAVRWFSFLICRQRILPRTAGADRGLDVPEILGAGERHNLCNFPVSFLFTLSHKRGRPLPFVQPTWLPLHRAGHDT